MMVRDYSAEVLENRLGETYVSIFYLRNPVPIALINLYDWKLIEKGIKEDLKEITELKKMSLKCFIDGNALCIVGNNFINLQESEAVFIDLTPKIILALNKLEKGILP